MHNLENLHNLEVLFENVHIAENVCESIHNRKVVFVKAQIAKSFVPVVNYAHDERNFRFKLHLIRQFVWHNKFSCKFLDFWANSLQTYRLSIYEKTFFYLSSIPLVASKG